MRKIFCLLSLSALLSCADQGKNESSLSSETSHEIINADSLFFPADWIGNYSGLLEIFNAKGKSMEVNMEVIIGDQREDGFYPWTLKYGEEDIRNYGLKLIDSTKNHYIIDEFNGIVLDAFAMDRHFVSHFSVGNSEITSIYKKIDEGIEFQIVSSNSDTITQSSSQVDDVIYEVGTFPVNVYQKAILKKTLPK